MKIYSLIQARGGSKGVPKKNIKIVAGYPLIAFSIIASKLCKRIQRTIVSTDSEEIAEISRKYGAEVPFLRPAKYASDKATDLDVFNHAIDWFEKVEKRLPDYLVQLRPTFPLRDPKVMSSAIEKIVSDNVATSLCSAHKLNEPPQKMLKIGKTGYWTGFFPDDSRPEYWTLPRQSFPDAYGADGYIDIVRPKFIKKAGVLYGVRSLCFISQEAVDIDSSSDFEKLEYYLEKKHFTIFEYLKKNFKKEKNVHF
jgi:CMP-N,N'-diacetyllegionaminic acid synthase